MYASEAAEASTKTLEGVLLAENTKTRTDAGGGLSGGYEVRGPVSKEVLEPVPPPQKEPAALIWKHPEESQGLKPQMHEAVEGMRKVPEVESVFISSGHRDPLAKHDPHADGRAVDVSRINGVAVQDLRNAQGEQGEKARQATANLEAWAKNNPNVNQIIGPNGGGEFKDGQWRTIPPSDPRVKDHQHHYHINVRR